MYYFIVRGSQVFIFLFTPLSTEALRQTGSARGLVQLVPIVVTLTVLLLREALDTLKIVPIERNEHTMKHNNNHAMKGKLAS